LNKQLAIEKVGRVEILWENDEINSEALKDLLYCRIKI